MPMRFLIGAHCSESCQGNCMSARAMKREIRWLCLLLSIVVLAAGCRGRRDHAASGTNPTTQTVAPAPAQPAPTGTDAMTQTVDVGDGRSEEDGGVTATSAPAPKKPQPKKKR
jgi:hypothetical protein